MGLGNKYFRQCIMGSNIHVLYICNLAASSVSWVASLITIITYLYKLYQRRKIEATFGQFVYNTHQSPFPSPPMFGGGYGGGVVYNPNSSYQPLLKVPQSSQYSKPRRINSLIFFLSIADFFTCTFIIISQVAIMGGYEITQTDSFCVSMRALIHFGFLSSFLWTNCIAFYLMKETFEWKPYDFPFLLFHVISWGIPLASVMSLYFADLIKRNESTGWCSIDGEYQLFFWVLPMVLSFCWNLVCYILIYKRFKNILSFGIYGARSTQLRKHIFRKLTFYLLAFLLCWVFDVINHTVFPIFNICAPYALYVLQDIATPLQGFLNFIVYVVTNKLLSCHLNSSSSSSYNLYQNNSPSSSGSLRSLSKPNNLLS